MSKHSLDSQRFLQFRGFKEKYGEVVSGWSSGREYLLASSGRRMYAAWSEYNLMIESEAYSKSWVAYRRGKPVLYLSVLQLNLSGTVANSKKEVSRQQLTLLPEPGYRKSVDDLVRLYFAATLYVFQHYGLQAIEVSIDADDVLEAKTLERIGYRFEAEGESETVKMRNYVCRWGDLQVGW